MNNIDFKRERECTGCFACLGTCKFDAITIEPDENGFYRPVVNADLCVGCGLCKKVCYSHFDIPKENAGLSAYYGWHRDADVVKRSASGGITTAISQAAMDNGYLVIGCTYDHSDRKAKHIILESPKDIPKLLGSKYFQSDLSSVVRTVSGLPRDTKILFLGTPCQVLGIKKLLLGLRFSAETMIFVELFCHGIASPLVWSSYVEELHFREIETVNFRTKDYGWHVPVNQFIKDGKTIPTKKAGDPFFEAYYSVEFFNKSCYNCEARKSFANSDLRIGDFWGKRFQNNKKGVSCVISASAKGQWLLEESKRYFDIYDADLNEVLSGQSYNTDPPFHEGRWHENFQILRQRGLKSALRNVNKRKPFSVRVKRQVFTTLKNIKSKCTKYDK